MSRTTIIIPVHNRRETTLACLRHLRATGDLANFAVLVVDDGSTDGTSEQVRNEFAGVELLPGNGQLWWTGAIARGMTHAFDRGADAVIWLNDDCWPDAGALSALVEQALAPPEKITAPACVDADTGRPFTNAFLGRRDLIAARGETLHADGLGGFCVVVPRAVWSRLGVPDAERFPHYFGDSAYTITATRAGFSALLIGSIRARLIGLNRPDAGARSHDSTNLRARFDRTFRSPKSPYRLKTLLAYQQLKYGPIAGSLLAALRGSLWLLRFALGGLRR